MIKRLLIAVAMSCAVTKAQVPVAPVVQPHVTFVDGVGLPCVGCKLYTYIAGTTTPLATYTDASGGPVNTNPIVLDPAGGANIWLSSNSYKLILKNILGTTIWSVDQVKGGGGLGGICGPSGAVQIANSSVNGLTCDANITINPTNHTLNVGTLPTNHVVIGPLGSPTLWTFDTTTPATALASLGGLFPPTSNSWANPLSFGRISNGSTATVTASGAAGAITLSAASDFSATQGVMIAHAGVPCGSMKGGGCAAPPTPAITNAGTAGSATYLYRLACIDGLGGIGIAGSSGGTTTGNATLAGVVTGTVLSGNYNIVSWTGNSACFEVAIYRNGQLIATEYSAPSGTMKYNDMGIAPWTNRDIPSAPPTVALNDNYIGIIQTLTGTSATVSPNLGLSVTAATLYHSDTPLIQAAITSSAFVTLPPLTYLVNYPINYTNAGIATGFNVSGMIDGPAAIICDTGDICLDVTGGNNIELANFSMSFGTTNPSSIDIYCSRDTAHHADLAQEVTTRRLQLQPGGLNALGGRGVVGFYNHACEIQHNYDDQFEAPRWVVITENNIDHVSSLFAANDDRGPNSMSQVDFYSASGGGSVVAELEGAFSISFYGGFSAGENFTAAHPWAFEVDSGEVGRLTVQAMRFENRGGLIDVAANAQLQEPTINVDLYRSATLLAGLPQIRLNAAAQLLNATQVVIDDYGGSGPVTAPLVDGGAGCLIQSSQLQLGIFETLGTCQTTGEANFIRGTGDWSLPVSYVMSASPTVPSWVKLGTWIFNIGIGGNTLDIRFFTGAGFDPGNLDKPAIADVAIRTGNNTSAPNISAASLTVSGQGQLPLTGLKVVATGGSTSITNASWDVYVNHAVFANGSYQVYKAPNDQWININTLTADPGTGATIVPGTLFHAPIMTTSTPSGTCTLNGFIPTVLNGVTVNIAICN